MKKEYIQVNCQETDCIHFSNCCKTCTEVCHKDDSNKTDVLFIGQGAGREEDINVNPTNINRQPFYGKSGKYLRAMIKHIWDIENLSFNIALSNTVRCHPKDQYGKNRDPYDSEIEVCKKHLLRDIATLQPKTIVALGRSTSIAMYPPFNEKTMSVIRGKVRYININNKQYPILGTYHPSYLTRQFGGFKSQDVNGLNVSLLTTINDIKTAISINNTELSFL